MGALKSYFDQAIERLQDDQPQEAVSATLLFGSSFDNEDGLLETVAELQRTGMSKHVVINGSEGQRFGSDKPGEAWAGRTVWEERLNRLGVSNIIWTRPVYHTRQENDAFLEIARDNGWKRVTLLDQPPHMPRAFLGMLKVMQEQQYAMKIYSVTPNDFNWDKEVFGSQGRKKMPRRKLLDEELKRIEQYQEKGDLASFDELFTYLEQREEM